MVYTGLVGKSESEVLLYKSWRKGLFMFGVQHA
jgi:hypothetical protein